MLQLDPQQQDSDSHGAGPLGTVVCMAGILGLLEGCPVRFGVWVAHIGHLGAARFAHLEHGAAVHLHISFPV